MGFRLALAARIKRSTAWAMGAVLLASCADAPPTPRDLSAPQPTIELVDAPRFATGPVGTACRDSERGDVTAQRCGCIQAAANLTLSQPQQKRAAQFFADPELLQAMKLSDTPANESFWDSWALFAETAERMCKTV